MSETLPNPPPVIPPPVILKPCQMLIDGEVWSISGSVLHCEMKTKQTTDLTMPQWEEYCKRRKICDKHNDNLLAKSALQIKHNCQYWDVVEAGDYGLVGDDGTYLKLADLPGPIAIQVLERRGAKEIKARKKSMGRFALAVFIALFIITIFFPPAFIVLVIFIFVCLYQAMNDRMG